MTAKVAATTDRRQEQPDSLAPSGRGKNLSLAAVVEGRELALIRQAIDDSEWTHEALATVLPVPSAAYISRMLSSEKAWTTRHTDALPKDIKARYRALAAEDEGLIVVVPINDQQAAVVQTVSGLISLLRSSFDSKPFPSRADHMAKASLPAVEAERRRA
jgi:hypothetical protein